MTQQLVVQLYRDALMTAFWLSMPLLAVGFVAGIAISFFQILTAMQDSAFATVPRLAAFLAGLLLFMPWMLLKITAYTARLLGDFSAYVR